MIRMLRIITLASLAFVMAACEEWFPTDDGGNKPSSELLTVKINSSEIFGSTNLVVTLDTVENDSRCPLGVECIWTGDAEVHLIFSDRSGRHKALSAVLHTNMEPNTARYLGYKIKLVELKPYPKDGEKLDPQDYIAVFEIE